MAQTFHETTARALIKSVIEGVTSIGVVHDYERFADDWDTLVSYFVSEIDKALWPDGKLRGWTIFLDRVDPVQQETFGAPGAVGTVEITYYYIVRGFDSCDDEQATQKTFTTLCLSLASALNAKAELHSSERDDGANGNFYGPPAGPIRFDWRSFGAILCHYVEMIVTVKEVI